MNPNAATLYGAYRQTQVQTASPTELVVMLYRGAIRFTKAGIEGVNRKDIAAAHTGFMRAQEIVGELDNALDFERGGEISTRLHSIYRFVIELLVQANVKKAAEPAEHAVQLLEELLSAWDQIGQAQKHPTGAGRAA